MRASKKVGSTPDTRRRRRAAPRRKRLTRPIAVETAAARERGSRGGQALAEFALILPVFMLLMLVAIDFGRSFFTYIDVNNAAREAANYAAGDPTDLAGILAAAQGQQNVQGQGGESPITTTSVNVSCADQSGVTIACATAGGGSGTGNTVTVDVTEQFTFVTPWVNSIFSGSPTMTASSTATVLVLAASAGSAPGECGTAPIAAFTYTVVGLTVQVSAAPSIPTTGECAISGYYWDMGDGKDPYPPITDINPDPYTYDLAGTYRITLSVANPYGEAISAQDVPVGVLPGPTPTPSPSPIPTPSPTPTVAPPVCNMAAGFTYQFTGTGNGTKKHQMTFYGSYTGKPAPTSWNWTFGDSTSGSGQTSARNYGSAGTYTVTLKISGSGCSSSVTQLVVVP
jgi:PKD repeat protein